MQLIAAMFMFIGLEAVASDASRRRKRFTC
jgi:hypothetical protein